MYGWSNIYTRTMNTRFLRQLAPLVLALLIPVCVNAQSDWHTYPERTMAELISITTPEKGQELGDLVISAKPFPSKSVITYLGRKRPLGTDARKLIEIWADSRSLPAETKEMLVDEYLFKENERELWLPVLKTMAPFIDKELKTGDVITAYYFFIGGYNSKTLYAKNTDKNKPPFSGSEQFTWMFVLEEFEAAKPKANQPSASGDDAWIVQPFTAAIDEKLPHDANERNFYIDPRQVKSRSLVTYTGQFRPTSQANLDFADVWGVREGMVGLSLLFKQEALFRMNGKDYWLPVSRAVVESMSAKLKPNDEVVIHVILGGGIPRGNTIDWIFLVGNYSLK